MAASETILLNPVNGPLHVNGGRYICAASATAWNGDSVAPVIVLPGGEDGAGVPSSKGGSNGFAGFTSNGFATFDLPPGGVDFSWGGLATGLLVRFTRIPCHEPRTQLVERIDLSDLQPHVAQKGGRYMFTEIATWNASTIGLAGLLPDGSAYAILNEISGGAINSGLSTGRFTSAVLVDIAPGQSVKLLTTGGTPTQVEVFLTSIPAS